MLSLVSTFLAFASIFSKENFYLEIQANELPETKIINDKFYDLAKLNGLELVATNNVYYVDRDGYELQDIIICIQSGLKVKEKNRKRAISKELYLKIFSFHLWTLSIILLK